MGYKNELRVLAQLGNELGEPQDICVVERSVHFVQDTERAGSIMEYCNKKGECRQSLLTAGEQQHALQALARRLGDNVDAAFQHIPLVQKAQIALPSLEQHLKDIDEILPDPCERLLKLLDGSSVYLRNCFLRVGNRLFNVGPLLALELVAFLQFLVLLEGSHIDRAKMVQPIAELIVLLADLVIVSLPVPFRDLADHIGKRNMILHLAETGQMIEIVVETSLFDFDSAPRLHRGFSLAMEVAHAFFDRGERLPFAA